MSTLINLLAKFLLQGEHLMKHFIDVIKASAVSSVKDTSIGISPIGKYLCIIYP